MIKHTLFHGQCEIALYSGCAAAHTDGRLHISHINPELVGPLWELCRPARVKRICLYLSKDTKRRIFVCSRRIQHSFKSRCSWYFLRYENKNKYLVMKLVIDLRWARTYPILLLMYRIYPKYSEINVEMKV